VQKSLKSLNSSFPDIEANFLKTDFKLQSYTDNYPLHIGDKFVLYGDLNGTFGDWVSHYYNTIISEDSVKKITSPKNKLFTLNVGILNS
jgi:hypothetical protein